jgi:hypothetical protein
MQAQEELRDCPLQLEEQRALEAAACLEEDPKVQHLGAEVDAKAMDEWGIDRDHGRVATRTATPYSGSRTRGFQIFEWKE